jgi:OmpA-OmpF porin, OOP family
MKRKAWTTTLAAALALCALPAAAQERGFYAGLSVGQATVSDACNGAGGGVSCDDSTTTWKVFGGYQFNRYLAGEVGYSDKIAEVSASAFGTSASVKASAWELVAVPSYPLTDQLSVYGKIGAYYAQSKASSGAKETDNGLTFGLGAGYQLTKNVGARVEWQRYSDLGGADVDALNVGLLYRF